MKYFVVKYDTGLRHPIQILHFNERVHVDFYREQADELRDVTTAFFSGMENRIFPDFIENPVYMASAKFYEILKAHEQRLCFKTCILSNPQLKMQIPYYLVLTDLYNEAVSSESEYHKNGWDKTLRLCKEKVTGRSVFQIKTVSSRYFVVSLAVAEGIMRRNPQGLFLTEIEVV